MTIHLPFTLYMYWPSPEPSLLDIWATPAGWWWLLTFGYFVSVVWYQLNVFTGSEPASDTEANVYIQLFGEKGDCGKRWLVKAANNEELFQLGQVIDINTYLRPSKTNLAFLFTLLYSLTLDFSRSNLREMCYFTFCTSFFFSCKSTNQSNS